MARRNRSALVRTPRKVFVCGTREDLHEERQAAIDAIESLGHKSIAMEKEFASPNPPQEECCRRVRESDFLILIVPVQGFARPILTETENCLCPVISRVQGFRTT